MKNILLSVILLYLSCSCSKPASSDTWFKWDKIDSTSDSIVRLLEYSYAESWPDSVRMQLLNALDSTSRHSKHPQLSARLLYWQAHMKWAHAGDSVKDILEQAMSITDSAKFLYDLRRMRTLEKSLPDRDIYESYRATVSDIAYYASRGDSVMLAASYQHLGVDLNEIADHYNAIEYLRKSNALYQQLGMEKALRKNMLNFAIALQESAPDKTDSILRCIREDIGRHNNSRFYILVLLQSYQNTHQVHFLEEASKLLKKQPDDNQLMLKVEHLLCTHYFMTGQTDSLYTHLDTAINLLHKFPNNNAAISVLSIAALREAESNNFETAFYYSQRCGGMMDSIFTKDRSKEIMRAESRLAIENLRNKNKQHKRVYLLTAIILVLLVCICILTIILIFSKRLHKQAVLKARIEKEMSYKSRQLRISGALMEEKDKLIDWVVASINDLVNENELKSGVAKEFESKIRNYLALRGNWGRLQEQVNNHDSIFADNLKSAFPEITDTQVMLAEYIMTGLNNKHIAQKMGISPDSVKKSRYRLRLKMGLPSGASLEEELRKYKTFS